MNWTKGMDWEPRYDYADWELELLTIGEPPIFRELILRQGIYPYA